MGEEEVGVTEGELSKRLVTGSFCWVEENASQAEVTRRFWVSLSSCVYVCVYVCVCVCTCVCVCVCVCVCMHV